MTITLYSVGARTSTRFTATANGSNLPIWGRTTDAHFSTSYWTAGQMVEQCGATVATDETLAVEVSLTSGSITSAKVYTNNPAGPLVSFTTTGGKLQFSLAPDTTVWCEINGVRGQPLLISSRLPVATPTGATVDIWNGTQTKAVAGRTLVFPPGEHSIGQSFEVEPGGTVFLHGEAWVIGSLFFSGVAGGARAFGHGILSGEWGAALRAYIRTLAFEVAIGYSMIRGSFSTLANSSVEGITVVDPPFYTTHNGPNVYDRVTLIGPWWGNANGFFAGSKFPELTASMTRCAAFVHDDVFDFGEYLGAHSTLDCIAGSIASAVYVVSYWPSPDSRSTHTATRTTSVCLNYATDSAGSLILAWSDGGSPYGGDEPDEAYHVVSDVDFNGFYYVGSVINGLPIDLRNRLYPSEWGGAQGTGIGQIRKFWFRNFWFETAPTFRSKIQGKDAVNTPHDLWFENVYFGPTRLTAANFDTFFDRNEFPYNIYVDGVPVADVYTTTGSWFATSPAVSPWSFLPATGRIGGSRALLFPLTVSWPGTSTPSRGVLPSIGGYDWGSTAGATAASASVSLGLAATASATSAITASVSASVAPTPTILAGVAIAATVAADLGPTIVIGGGPVAGVAAAIDLGMTASSSATASSAAALSVSLDLAPAPAGGPIVEVGAASSLGLSVAPVAASLVEASQVTADLGPAITIAATAETAGALSAYLDASIGPALTIGGEVETTGAADVTLPELGAELVGEPLIEVAAAAAVELEAAIEGEPVIPSELFAGAAASLAPSFEVGAETLSTASLAATLDLEHVTEAELDGVYNLRTAELEVIRTALLGMLGRSAATAGATVIYEAEPQGPPPPATATILRATMLPVTRQLIGHDGEPLIQQDGRMQIQVLFPRGTGTVVQVVRVLAVAARYPAQTVVASVGVTLTGGADVRRIGQENGRTRWDVTIPWRSMRVETAVSDTEQVPTLQTVEGALEAMRTIWHTRIEQPVSGEGWAGLRTYYDDVGPFEVPPPVPWAGVWTEAFGTSSREASGPTETVLGQVLVQIHTDKSLGAAGALRIVNRIGTEHNRQFRSVVVGVATVTGSRVTPAGTWQTTLRIPFRFEKLRG